MRHRMSGVANSTVLQHIPAHHPPVPVVMMTSHPSNQVVAQPLATGSRAEPSQNRGLCGARGVGPGPAMRCRNGSVRAVVSGTRNEIENNATGDGPMSSSFAHRP